MDERVQRDLRFLKGYSLILTVLFGVMSVLVLRQGQTRRLTELDVERINIVEPNGAYRMVLSNRERSTGPIYRGQPFGYPGGTRPGIIFFNDEGTENGGLTFGGERQPDGTFRASHHLSFDQYEQDQIVVLNYTDDTGRRRMGLTIGDRADVSIFDLVAARDSIMKLPAGPEQDTALRRWAEPRDGVPLYAPRVYVGRDVTKSAIIDLADPMGRTRIRMKVDSLGTASLEFLDATGAVTARFPR
jgi:hypothetical protein